MRPSPRLSFLAAACTVAMMASSAVALDFEYDMSFNGEQPVNDNVAKAWRFTNISASDGHAQINSNKDEMISTNSFAMPITNVLIQYKCSNANPPRKLHLMQVLGEEDYGDDYAFTPTTSKTWVSFPFPASDNVKGVYLYPISGQSGNWNIYHITIQTADPPPTITIQSPPQQAGTASDLVVHFAATSFEGDAPLTFSATATNLTSGVTITDQSYFHFDHNYSMMHPDYYDFTFHTPAGLEPCEMRFTITATGRGGSASQSFDCTFTEGVVPTPPQIYSPWLNPPFVLAGRTISGRVGCEEADGDEVTFSFVSGTSQQGTFTIDPSSGDFSFTPTLQDVGDSPEVHVFTVRATDKDDSSDANITIVVFPVSQPKLTPIDDLTMAFGDTLLIDLEAEATEYVQGEYIDDPLISSNITIKAGTTAPEGEYVFEDGCLSFTPNTNDVGQTFIFTASATDFDGTTNQDFNVTVGLAKPVLKHCPIDDWTATSFTANLEAAIPGATSYTLRYVHNEDDGTVVTGYVNDATFPCVVENLSATNYVYDVQAKRGATTSAWSNAKSIDLHKYIAPTYAIPMTGAARGSHHETFDGLISSGSAYWYDARTIPGWYAASSSGSMSDVKYAANTGGSSGTGILSCQVDDEAVTNRALAARADTQYDEFSFGVMFTNMCKYAVTNLHVSFTAMQFRRYNPISHLYFSYTRSNRLIDYNDPANIWTPVGALDFAAPTQGSSARLYPPTEVPKSADIPFEGVNAIQPGEVIALRWYLDAKSNYPTLGIDDLEVSWRCAWPSHTVIMLQ